MKTLKHITTTLLFLLAINVIAQQGINYKALIKDGGGNVVASQNITIQFKILQGVGMTNVYQETHTLTTDTNGIVIINIGEGTQDSGNYNTIDWGADDHYLNVQINTGGGLTDMGTTQFMTVPYALHAENLTSNSIKIDDLSDGKSDSSSVFLGLDAGLNDDSTDNKNVGIGFEALKSNTTGGLNTANGYQPLYYNTTGNFNVANGYQALYNNIDGGANTANGYQALYSNTTGSNNTANSYRALYSNTTGRQNTANGNQALYFNTEGILNTANGYRTLYNTTTGNNNTAIGFGAGLNNSIGHANVFIGYSSGFFETGSNTLYVENSNADPDTALIYGEFGVDNTATDNILRTNSQFQIGNPTGTGFAFPVIDGTSNQVLQTNGNGSLSWVNESVYATKINDLTDGKSDNDGTQDGSSLFIGVTAGLNDDSSNNQNVGIGFEALFNNITGNQNTAIGYKGLFSNSTGNNNTAIGSYALNSNTIGLNNTANGHLALARNTIGDKNTAIGTGSLRYNTSGSYNTANGYWNLFNNTTGNRNTATGHESLYNNSTGYDNSANGNRVLYSNTTGYYNSASGSFSLYKNTEGIENTSNGYFALYNNSTGNYNTANGSSSLLNNTSGIKNTANGYSALALNTTGSNNTGIGFNARVPDGTLDNQVRIGDINVNHAGIQVAWTVTSDKRWKENIRELPYGLDVVKQLKPVDYIRKNKDAKTREMGFIAQDVEALLNKVGYTDQGFLHKDDKGLMSLRYNDFIALLTKAIQEQQEIIEEQNKNYEKLLKRVEQLELVSNQ